MSDGGELPNIDRATIEGFGEEWSAVFDTLRTDTLDCFGTCLEQKFTRQEIKEMMQSTGFTGIQLSAQPPYWVALGRRA